MDCIYPVSAFDIDVSGIVVNSAYGGDAGDLNFDINTTDSNVSGTSTGEDIPENNGLLVVLEYDDTNADQICFEYSSITTYVGIEYEAILGDCVDVQGDNDGGGDDLIDVNIILPSFSNLISFYGLPDDLSLENVFSSLDGNIYGVIGQGAAAVQVGGNWVGSLTHINPASGYWVTLQQAQDTLSLSGVNPLNPNLIYDMSAGLNLLSFPAPDSLDVPDALPDEFEGIIYSIIGGGEAAQFIDGEWFGSLTQFSGGKGYWFRSYEDILFNFENIDLSRYVNHSNILSISDNSDGYNQSTRQAFYFVENIDGVEEGDIIESYYNSTLVGKRIWSGEYSDIPVMGDDGTHYTSGYLEVGSRPRFKLVKVDGREYWLEGDVPNWGNNQLFILNSLSVVQEIPGQILLKDIYPNPFNPSTTITFEIFQRGKVLLEVYDLNGFKVSSLSDGFMESGTHELVWDATGYSSGVYFVKLVSGKHVETRKILLIK